MVGDALFALSEALTFFTHTAADLFTVMVHTDHSLLSILTLYSRFVYDENVE